MSKFKERILDVVKLVPKGKVVSYGQVALMAGVPKAARAVGHVLHEFGETTCWWRVINNAGRISTKCIEHDASMQKGLLESEGIKVTKGLKLDINRYRFIPNQKIVNKLRLDDKYVEELSQKYLI